MKITDRIKIAFIFCCLITSAIWLIPFSAQGRQSTKTAAPAQQSKSNAPKNYEKFTHLSHVGTINVPGTNDARVLKCDSCHERRDVTNGLVPTTERNKRLSLKFPGHSACVECHVTQFTAKPQQTCTICHDTKQGLIARPPQRDFPQRYDYNAFFDAKQHELHVTYNLPNNGNKLDCNFCHKQEAKPAPLAIASHPECYVCHSPNSGDQKASQKSDCLSCHTQMTPGVQPFSAKYISRAYGARFTHKAHVGYMGNRCDMCHTISGGYNQPAPTSLKIKQHVTPAERSGRGCFSCHDGGMHYGRKVFSGEPGTDGGGSCNKCHTRDDFKVFPSAG